ncbi:hypothetical protein [Kordiimonas lacus]|uniref:Uncharacterized protein n=1 Tax=Kordiimonas lacus TaxID=637679 RepID=A0A1G7AVD7_9PROT|nr:hypothetical protein [Kordiimonas lacus]SDE17965.1 hypothetical protein SAMN04488071_2209 [Kordiimonas lacus]
MKRNLRLVSAAMTLFMTGAVQAQSTEIPQELLDLDRQRCLTECVPGFGEETCKPLCDCTVSEFKKRLDFSRYLELSAQLSRNELNPENRTFLDVVAQYCTAELDKSGVQIGTGDETTGQ